jgi:hypothetical protein
MNLPQILYIHRLTFSFSRCKKITGFVYAQLKLDKRLLYE